MKLYFLLVYCFIFNQICIGQPLTCHNSKNSNRKYRSVELSSSDLIRMEKYDINYLIMNLHVTNTTKEINGYVTHQGCFKNEIDSILLELDPDFIIDSIYINTLKTNYFRKKQTILIPNYKKDFNVCIYYHGSIKNIFGSFMNGSGVVNGTHEQTKNKVTYTLSEPFSASKWWPSKQSLNDKIDSADLYFTTDNSNLVGSNGILISKKQINNNLTQFHWKTRYPTTYYLFSFSVGPYLDYSFKTFIPEIKDSILVQNFIYNDSEFFKGNKNNIDLTSDYIKLYSNLFGIYPFHKEKYGHCLSTIGGGMEHQTMTTLNSFDPALVSHELAHQWFGNHVTCSSFKDIWLNEGFATYSEYLMFEKLYPEKKDLLLGSYIQRAKTFKTGSVYVQDTLNESRIFSRELTYDKGALIIHTLRYLINNDSLFFKSLKEYQTKFSHSFASAIDFKKIVEQICGIDLTIFFNEWYYGEGYPIYAIQTEKSTETKIHLQQYTSSSKTTLFTTPLELLIARENLPDTLIRFTITKNLEVLNFPNSLKISYVKSIDPHNYILHENTPFLGSNELDSKIINVFPNPCQSELTIQINNPNSYRVRLINIDGQEVFNSILNSTYKLKTEEFKNGIYILEISDKKSVYSQKIIID